MKRSPLILTSLFLLLAASCNHPEGTIAVVDGKNYSRNDIKDVYNPDYFAALDTTLKAEKLQLFADRIASANEVSRIPVEKKGSFRTTMFGWEERYLLEHLYDQTVVLKTITPATLRRIHRNMSRQRHVKHIFVNIRNKDRENTIWRLNRALTTDNFESLASRYSDDKMTAKKGGDLGFVSSGQMPSALDSAIFEAPLNKVSAPVQTMYGTDYFIVTEDKQLDTLSFEKQYDAVLNMARKMYAMTLRKKGDAYLDSVNKANHLYIYSKNLYLIADSLHSWNVSPNRAPEDRGLLPFLYSLSDSLPIAVCNDTLTLYQDWLIKYILISPKDAADLVAEQQIERFMQKNFWNYCLAVDAKSKGIQNEPAFREGYRRTSNDAAYKFYLDYSIKNANPSDSKLKTFYDKNREKLWKNPAEVQVQEVFVRDSLLSAELYARLRNGENFDSVAVHYTERKNRPDSKGVLPYFVKGRYGAMGDAAFTMKSGEIGGPFHISDGYSIIRVLDHKDESFKPFDEVKDNVKTSWLRENKNAIVDKSLKKLRRKHHVKLYPQAL